MPLSPLRSPSHARLSRRGSGPSAPMLLMLALAGLFLVWLLWRFGFGLEARVGRAVSLADAGQAQQALDRLNELKESHPGSAEVLDGLGVALDRLGRPQEAQADYALALQGHLDRGAARLHCEEGRRALGLAQWDVAQVEYDQALALDPHSAPALAGKAAVTLDQGFVSKAVGLYQQALAVDPDLEFAKQGLGTAQQALSRGSIYTLYDRNGEPLARQAVTADGLGGMSYPRDQLTAHVVGYLSAKHGDTGLERDLKGLFPACSVELTLDSRLEEDASRALGDRRGAIVALDPDTGEILCAVSQPTYQPERIDKEWWRLLADSNQPLESRALEGLFQPGSIAKIMTAAAALGANVDMAKLFPMTPPLALKLGDKVFWDWKRHGELLSLKAAMDVSSNIALYRVAEAMGPDVLMRTINLFGFNRDMDLGFTMNNGTHVDIQAARPFTPTVADSQFALADLSCGLGDHFRASPLQAARMAMVIANGGKLMKPQLVRSVHSLSGDLLYSMQPQVVDQAISAATAQRIRKIMVDCVESERGIGKRARVPGIVVAGKTGTARTDPHGALDAWFICFAPADHPKLAVAVFCDQEGTGMSIAAPIAGKFLAAALQ